MQTVLIIQTAFIGDVILATALIEKIHAFYPAAKIDFLVRKGNESLLVEHPFIRKVIVWDKQTTKYKNLTSIAREIRTSSYEYVINLQRFASTGWLTARSGAKHKIGFAKNPFSFFYTKKLAHQIGNGTHEVARNLSLISHLTDEMEAKPKLYPSTVDFKKVEHYKEEAYICIAPTSVWHTKQFPAEKWIELINNLPANHAIYLLGGPADQSACDEIKTEAEHPKTINLAGELSLLASAALMRDAAMNYVNDSAPMHLASAMNASVTAIFCSTIPEFGFTPLSDNHYVVQTPSQLTCRPCGLHGKKTCKIGTFECAQSINIEEMIVKIKV